MSPLQQCLIHTALWQQKELQALHQRSVPLLCQMLTEKSACCPFHSSTNMGQHLKSTFTCERNKITFKTIKKDATLERR